MDTSQIVQTLSATIVGGCIVIATNWLSMRAKKQESIQDWYEKTYVLEGLDPIIEYLLSLRLHVINVDVANSMKLPDISTVPIEALAKVQQLLNETTVSGIIVLLHASMVSEERSKSISATEAALETTKVLLDFRRKLLEATATKLKSKSFHLNSSLVISQLNLIFDELQKNNPHMFSWRVPKEV